MSGLAQGIYEHLITGELADQLHQVDSGLVQRDKLDPADAPDALARHIAALARRALHAVPGGDDKLARQVDLANRIAEIIAAFSPQAATAQDQVADAKYLLHAIAAPPTPPAQPVFPARPPPRSPPARCSSTAVTSRASVTRSPTRWPPPTRWTYSARSSSGTAWASSSRPSAT
ncbi:hypothetical protein [Micromonospora kangleipakensis]|uniref:hypothetical protein n=1 Tax=Micromonospora kangleipakensis TaxID=1077942 RepID=UPI001F5FA67A|nr:hypothetical protein [Micromonospora kangleipakensis]